MNRWHHQLGEQQNKSFRLKPHYFNQEMSILFNLHVFILVILFLNKNKYSKENREYFSSPTHFTEVNAK